MEKWLDGNGSPRPFIAPGLAYDRPAEADPELAARSSSAARLRDDALLRGGDQVCKARPAARHRGRRCPPPARSSSMVSECGLTDPTAPNQANDRSASNRLTHRRLRNSASDLQALTFGNGRSNSGKVTLNSMFPTPSGGRCATAVQTIHGLSRPSGACCRCRESFTDSSNNPAPRRIALAMGVVGITTWFLRKARHSTGLRTELPEEAAEPLGFPSAGRAQHRDLAVRVHGLTVGRARLQAYGKRRAGGNGGNLIPPRPFLKRGQEEAMALATP